MSTHSNQHDTTPTSSRKEIRGANPTYKTSIQKEMTGDGAKIHKAGEGKETEKVEGSGSAPTSVPVNETAPGFGSGHYTPNK